MVGNIDHDGLALFEALHDLIHDGVVIEDGVVIVGQDAALPRVEVGFEIYVIVALEMFAVFRTALSVHFFFIRSGGLRPPQQAIIFVLFGDAEAGDLRYGVLLHYFLCNPALAARMAR